MKKFMLILLATLLILALAACGTPDVPAEPYFPDLEPPQELPSNLLDIDAASYKVVILYATEKYNLRHHSGGTAVAGKDEIVYVELGDEHLKSDINLKRAPFYGEIESKDLQCAPVVLCFDEEGTCTEVIPLGEHITLTQADITLGEDGKLYAKGQELKLDPDTLGSVSIESGLTPDCYALRIGQGMRPSAFSLANVTYGILTNGDDMCTFYDMDSDGDFDFMRQVPIYNGGKVIAINDEAVVLKGSFGSADSHYSWHNGTNKICYELADPNLKIEAGDRVNFYCQYDITVEKTAMGNLPAKWVITGVCPKIEGKLESLEIGKKENGDLDYTNIKVTVDGKEYTWSTNMIEDDQVDGKDGIRAGRTGMNDKNIGKTFTFWLDDAGYIVCAEAVLNSN